MTEPLIDCVIEHDAWEEFGLDALAMRAARAVFAHLDLPEVGYTICLMGCDDARIAELNADFRGKSQPTNVLSWPSDSRESAVAGVAPEIVPPGDAADPLSLGDIAIAYETCTREALHGQIAFADHVTHLIVHGILHLFGYDHINDLDANIMEQCEIEILAKLGIANPY